MFLRPSREDLLDRLTARIRRARAITPNLMADVIEHACTRFSAPDNIHEANRIRRFLRAGAWVDAVLALIELELPQWSVRFTAGECGEWQCVLSERRVVIDWLDNTVEGRHEGLVLAILAAFVQALRLSLRPRAAAFQDESKVFQRQLEIAGGVCCDNFGR